MKLDVYYDSDTDTLSLWNGQPASGGADVAENLTVDLDAEGEAVGFTLEHASEVLKEIVARPFAVCPPEGFALAGMELLTEMLKAVGKRPLLVGNPQGFTLADNEIPPEMLKAVGERSVIAGNPQGFTLAGSELSPEMLKAVGERSVIVLSPGGFTPEDIEKWGICSTAWGQHTGHFVDSGKK